MQRDIGETGPKGGTSRAASPGSGFKKQRNPGDIRIALVTPYYWPILGGITTFVDCLAKGLRERGFTVRIWTRYGQCSETVERGPQNPLAFVRWARKGLKAWHPTVVHAHSHWYTLASAFTWKGAIAESTVFSVHTEIDPMISGFRKFALSHLLAKADTVTALGPASASALQARFPRIRRVEQVAPGVRELPVNDAAVVAAVESYGLARSFPRLCSLGMMVWPEKVRGMEVLVKSMPLVLRRYPTAKLIFVGDGPLRQDLVASARTNRVQDSVVFAGAQVNPGAIIAASEMLVHCSFKDAFPQAILEALRLGRPVIANTQVASNISLSCVDLGITAVAPTPQSYADAVLSLAGSDTLRREMGRTGEVAVSTRFTWSAAVDRFVSVYDLP